MLIYFQTFTRPIWPTFRIQNDWGLNRVLWWTTASQCSRAVPSSSSRSRSTPRPTSAGVLRWFVSARNYNLFTFILQVPHICTVVSQLDIISPYSWPTVPQNLKCEMGLSLVGASISLLAVSFQSCQCKILNFKCKMPNFKCKMDLSLDGASISPLTVSFQSCQCKI